MQLPPNLPCNHSTIIKERVPRDSWQNYHIHRLSFVDDQIAPVQQQSSFNDLAGR